MIVFRAVDVPYDSDEEADYSKMDLVRFYIFDCYMFYCDNHFFVDPMYIYRKSLVRHVCDVSFRNFNNLIFFFNSLHAIQPISG